MDDQNQPPISNSPTPTNTSGTNVPESVKPLQDLPGEYRAETTPPFPISPPTPDTNNSGANTPEAEESLPVQGANAPPPPPPAETPPPEPGEPAKIVDPLFKRLIPVLIGLGVLALLVLLVTKLILPRTKKVAEEPQSVSLSYWGLWEPETVISTIIKDYQVNHPNVTIQYTRQSHKDYRERLQSALARGDGPDIFRFHNTWLPMLKNDLAPVSDSVFTSNEFDTTFYPVVKRDVYSAGKYYGIPLEFDSLALYVNEDIMAQNPDQKIPTTWDNLRSTAFKLTQKDDKGNPIRAGVAMGTTENIDNFSDIIGLMILQNGGNPGKPDTEAVSSALKFYTLFTTQDKIWSSTLPNSSYAFATSKVAMIIAPSWRAFEINQINPQLNFKLYPVPQLPGTNVSWATYWIEGVSKKSANSDAAFEFLKYLSSKDTLQKMYGLAAQNRLFGEPFSRQDMAPTLQNDPYLGSIVSQAISSQSWYLASRTFDNGLNDKLIKYYQDAVNSYLKAEPEKNITSALTQGVSQVLSQYNLSQ